MAPSATVCHVAWSTVAPKRLAARLPPTPETSIAKQEFLAVLRQTRASVQLAVGSGKTKDTSHAGFEVGSGQAVIGE